MRSLKLSNKRKGIIGRKVKGVGGGEIGGTGIGM